MKTEFPFLNELILSGEVDAPPADIKLIEAQEAFDRYWLDDTDVMGWDKHFGPLTPPYDRMWIEARAQYPVGPPTKGKISQENFTARMGCTVTYSDIDTVRGQIARLGRTPHEDARWACVISVFTERIEYGSTKNMVPAYAIYEISADGRMLHAACSIMETVREDMHHIASNSVLVNAKAALFAIGLMNCRNVKVEPKMTIERRSKKSRRPRKPSIEYHVIKLPGSNPAGPAPSQSSGTQRQHTARGHFKTYTAEAPLMGRHVGTYYWGWQVRGRKENGEIISSYKVGV